MTTSTESTPDITRSLMLCCSRPVPDTEDVAVDFDVLLHNLLLFDSIIIDSIKLREIPHFVRTLGYEGTISLLESRLVKIYCHAMSVASASANFIPSGIGRREPRPPLSYYFDLIQHESKWYVSENLAQLRAIEGIGKRENQRLRQLVAARLVPIPPDLGRAGFSQFRMDSVSNIPLLKRAVRLEAKRRRIALPPDFSLRIHPLPDDREIQVETDLVRLLMREEAEVHVLIEQALLGVSRLNQRIELMQQYSTLSGEREEDLPLLEDKLRVLTGTLSPDAPAQRWQRIANLLTLPSLNVGSGQQDVNIARFMELLQSDECREFRDWLRRSDALSDDEIRELTSSIRARLSLLFDASGAKVLRFLVLTGLGLFVSPDIIVALGAIDAFLVAKVLPRSGPAAFVNELYPSLFE